MPTTNAITFKNCRVEYSTNGTVYTLVNAEGTAVEVGDASRVTSDVYAFDSDTALVLAGKREPVDVTVRLLYTDADPFDTLLSEFVNANTLYIRWSPKGGTSGTKQYTASGPITTITFPQGEASSPDPVAVSVTIRAAEIAQTTVV